MEFLFVYGSLRPGAHLPERTSRAAVQDALRRARAAGSGWTPGRLYRVSSWYPAMVEAQEPGDRVHGDVLAVPDEPEVWAVFDAFEEAGPRADPRYEYHRARVAVTTEDGRTVDAWAYFYNRPVREADRISGGDFLKAQA